MARSIDFMRWMFSFPLWFMLFAIWLSTVIQFYHFLFFSFFVFYWQWQNGAAQNNLLCSQSDWLWSNNHGSLRVRIILIQYLMALAKIPLPLTIIQFCSLPNSIGQTRKINSVSSITIIAINTATTITSIRIFVVWLYSTLMWQYLHKTFINFNSIFSYALSKYFVASYWISL